MQGVNGYIDKPNPDKVKEVAAEGLNWSNPNWKHYDGTKAEW